MGEYGLGNKKPEITKTDRVLGDRYEHEAFGSISISKSQGTKRHMFMSNVQHSNFITLEVKQAAMSRSLNRDRMFAGDMIVRVSMTKAQFAELISSMGDSSGAPCTLNWVRGEGGKAGIDGEPTTKRFSKEAEAEFKKLAAEVQTVIDETRAELEAAKVSKKRQEVILAPMSRIVRMLGDTLPFMQDQFVEAMEGVVHEARSIVETYAEEKGITEDEAPQIIDQSDESS